MDGTKVPRKKYCQFNGKKHFLPNNWIKVRKKWKQYDRKKWAKNLELSMTLPFCVCSDFLLLATEAGFIGMGFGAGTGRKACADWHSAAHPPGHWTEQKECRGWGTGEGDDSLRSAFRSLEDVGRTTAVTRRACHRCPYHRTGNSKTIELERPNVHACMHVCPYVYFTHWLLEIILVLYSHLSLLYEDKN